MAPIRRRDLVTSRRRVVDEGEEDEAEVASAEYDSPTEPSILSDTGDSLDAEESEGSDADGAAQDDSKSMQPKTNGSTGPSHQSEASKNGIETVVFTQEQRRSRMKFANTADTDAMVNGFESTAIDNADDAVNFEDTTAPNTHTVTPSRIQETAQRANNGGQTRRGDMKRVSPPAVGGQNAQEVKPKSAVNPQSAPTAGGIFVHDRVPGAGVRTGFPPLGSGRPRRRGPPGNASASWHTPQLRGLKSDRWDHDLHETVAHPVPQSHQRNLVSSPPKLSESAAVMTLPASGNKSVPIGTVSCRILLAGMQTPIVFEKVPVKQHTRLPEPRPPLRRDKPVRVSLPGHSPKYIFPSTERSFIFIPRAQRPNQQGTRFRARGAFSSQYGSRRTSIFGGSNYTSSLAMSRRSSQARDGLVSPVGSTFSRPPANIPTGPSRPVVRLPGAARSYDANVGNSAGFVPSINGQSGVGPQPSQAFPLPARPTYRENRDAQIPMYQPRPQKTVSVATIESPTSAPVHAPKQQEQQPFHQQVPAHIQGPTSPREQFVQQSSTQQTAGVQAAPTPSSNLPNRAVNAQPFQPTPQEAFYQPYPMQNMYYYPQPEQPMQYGNEQGPAMYVQPTQQGNYLVPMLLGAPPSALPPSEGQRTEQSTTLPYESNGTIYYYDPSQFTNSAEGMMHANYAVPGAGGMMTPGPEGYFYAPQAPPPMVFFPPQP